MPGPAPSSVEETLAEAARKSGIYEYSTAAQLLHRALDQPNSAQNPLQTAQVAEQLAKCCYDAAFQSETRDNFKHLMQLAQVSYEKAAASYEEAGSEAPSKMSRARSLFSAFWLKEDPADKRTIMEKCIPLAHEAARSFDTKADKKLLAESYYDLVIYLKETVNFATERKVLVDQFEEAVEIAWKAISEFQGLVEDEVILRHIHALVLIYAFAGPALEEPKYEALEKKIEKLREKIVELSNRIGTPFAACLAGESAVLVAADLEGDMAKATDLFEATAPKTEIIRDSYMIGRLFTLASGHARLVALAQDDVDKRRELLEKALRHASKAIKNLEVSSAGAWLKLAYGRLAEASNYLALAVETDAEKKRMLLRKAIETARRGMLYENHGWVAGGGHELSKAMYFLATLDVSLRERSQLLSEALAIREEMVRVYDELSPHSPTCGIMHNYLALLKSELSSTEEDAAKKVELLKSAALHMRTCADLSVVVVSGGPVPPGRLRAIAQYQEWNGDILIRLHGATQEASASRRAIEAYEEAISFLNKSASLGPIPAVRWKIAQAFDSTSDFREASRAFSQAAEEYRTAAKKIMGLSAMFTELGQYMEAWAIIEDARLRHYEEHYISAAEDYLRAAGLLETTKAWNNLSTHYIGCSLLERGEALSRQERQAASVESFTAAVDAFKEARSAIETKLKGRPGSQETRELRGWLEVTDGRQRYCLGRVELEEAKTLDKRGDEEASSAKYRSASEVFRTLVADVTSEQSRRELETLTLVCDAWAKMKDAETKASPELYAEAANFFDKIGKTTSNRRFRFLAMANEAMCRALESGTRFRRTRETRLYAEIKRQLEAATDYYEEAGIKNSADWTRATQRLFDALVYLADAETEKEPRKKTELFQFAEKHFRLAARLYEEAGFGKKKEEALRHLRRAQEAKELLIMPVEVLAENPAVTEVAVAPVSLMWDKAVGLERFEGAQVVGNLIISQREMYLGEELTFELHIANVGRTTATLINIENIPPEGLEFDRANVHYRLEDHTISLRGKRLDYLKGHEVKIDLKAVRKGTFELRPRITFADDKGVQGSYELEPASVTVRELGIAGWIKGPGR